MHLQEEISHCGAGVQWLTYLFEQAAVPATQESPAAAVSGNAAAASSEDAALQPQNFPDAHSWFHALVRRHFKGDLKVRASQSTCVILTIVAAPEPKHATPFKCTC